MGVDLTLIPVETPSDSSIQFGHDLLNVSRDYDMYEQIRNCTKSCSYDVPRKLHTFMGKQPNGEYGYGVTFRDAYGEPLKMVPASLISHCIIDKHVRLYLQNLPPNFMVVLYWH